MSNYPIQKILFGSPGTGKSYKITGVSNEEQQSIKDQLEIKDSRDIIKTVFHPEYTYGDFIGKLLPQTTGSNSVIYKYYPGYFLRALGRAYRNVIDGNNNNVLLVIDELNRGNAPAIFGIVFQLLDRRNNGWSEYEVNLSMLEISGLLESMNYVVAIDKDTIMLKEKNATHFSAWHDFYRDNSDQLRFDYISTVLDNLNNQCISIPANLSIVATINTSDESIYYLDSAFKRRWDWEYIEAPHRKTPANNVPQLIRQSYLFLKNNDLVEEYQEQINWGAFIICLNEFIKSNSRFIKRIDDKQIGWWFISPDSEGIINIECIKNKLMFYLWDSVFPRDKFPLQDYLKTKYSSLITYADFVDCTESFILKIYSDFGGNKKEEEIQKIESELELIDFPF